MSIAAGGNPPLDAAHTRSAVARYCSRVMLFWACSRICAEIGCEEASRMSQQLPIGRVIEWLHARDPGGRQRMPALEIPVQLGSGAGRPGDQDELRPCDRRGN